MRVALLGWSAFAAAVLLAAASVLWVNLQLKATPSAIEVGVPARYPESDKLSMKVTVEQGSAGVNNLHPILPHAAVKAAQKNSVDVQQSPSLTSIDLASMSQEIDLEARGTAEKSAHKISTQHATPTRQGTADPTVNPVREFQTLRKEFKPPGGASLAAIPPESAVAAGTRYVSWKRQLYKTKNPRPELQASYGMKVKEGADPAVINRINVWGERHSCTTLLFHLLKRNFQRKGVDVTIGPPWKHEFIRRSSTKQSPTTLHVLVSKHPYEWILSMRSNPYHGWLHTALSFPDFLTTEWAMGDKFRPKRPSTVSVTPHKVGAPVLECSAQAPQNDRCRHEGEEYSCSSAPGFEIWKGTETVPFAACLPAKVSRRWCRHSFLCKASSTTPWAGKAAGSWWKVVAQQKLSKMAWSAQSRLPPRKLTDSDRCAVRAGDSLTQIPCRPPLPGSALLACTNSSLGSPIDPPWPGCLSGAESRGVCAQGKHLCDANKSYPWEDRQKDKEGRLPWPKMLKEVRYVKTQLQYMDEVPMRGEYAAVEAVQDRDPDTGFRFPTVMALRTAKLMDWLRESENFAFAGHIPCRELQLDPSRWLGELERTFKLKRAKKTLQLTIDCGFSASACSAKNPNATRQISKSLQATWISKYTAGTFAIVNAWLDPEVEAAVGYSLYPTLKMAGRPFTNSTRCLHLPPQLQARECPGLSARPAA